VKKVTRVTVVAATALLTVICSERATHAFVFDRKQKR
jgi:hypothetical protein